MHPCGAIRCNMVQYPLWRCMPKSIATPEVRLLALITRKDWWHVPPEDPKAYSKRGLFLASTYREAEFWGRPLDTPIRVSINKPLIGDEHAVEIQLLGMRSEYPGDDHPKLLEWRWSLDARLKKAGLAKGYDSIVLLSPIGYSKFQKEGKLPRSMELNLLHGAAQASGLPQE